VKLLRKITELVDRDVAANSKPISLIGMAIPFVPFMIFVDGAPADSFPVLGGLALALSLGWCAFVLWRGFRHTGSELESYGFVIGSARFWRLTIGTLIIIALVSAAAMWFEGKFG
jgi:hypothetical protein